MEQIYFGERISTYRRQRGLTQEALAQKLGVTNQAVSKWESDQNYPDVMLFPALADEFGVSIDELFGRGADTSSKSIQNESPAVPGVLPWPNDDDLRVVCFVGHRLGDYRKMNDNYVLRFSGTVNDIHSGGCVIVEGGAIENKIQGNVDAGGYVTCGNVGGSVSAGGNVDCGDVSGNVDAGHDVNCKDILGSASAGNNVNCEGDVLGSVDAGNSVKCCGVAGKVTAGNSVSFGDIEGDVNGDEITSE